ncbi:hypothetical protein AB4400_29550, partial [Vibrio sp. 10N.261.48.A2]
PNIINGFEESVIRNFEKAGVSGYSSLMLKVGENTSFHRFFADPYSRATYSTEPKEWQYTEALLNQGVDIHEAIEK